MVNSGGAGIDGGGGNDLSPYPRKRGVHKLAPLGLNSSRLHSLTYCLGLSSEFANAELKGGAGSGRGLEGISSQNVLKMVLCRSMPPFNSMSLWVWWLYTRRLRV